MAAFADDAHYEALWRHQVQGWAFTKTRITETYSWENYLADISGKALLIGVVRNGSQLSLHAPSVPVRPRPGDVVVSYVPADDLRATTSKRTNAKLEAVSDAKADALPANPEPGAGNA